MTLSADQLTDMQGDLGITADGTVFTDAELQRLYARTEEDYAGAVFLGWRQLMADTAKFFNYTAGQSKVERAAVFDHVKAMVEFWKGESTTASQQVAVVGLLSVPPNDKDVPATEYDCGRPRRRGAVWWR